MNILVVGGFGYLGCHISDHYLRAGHKVRVLSRTPHLEWLDWINYFDVRVGDISRTEDVQGCCKDIEVVIQAAGLDQWECSSNGRSAILVNGWGTRNLLEDARKNKVKRFIYLSTFQVHGSPKGLITEDTIPTPLTDYSISHYLGELYCTQYSVKGLLRTYILRLSNVYGFPLFKNEKPWKSVLNILCDMSFNNGIIALETDGTQGRDFVGIDDILQGLDIFVNKDIKDGHIFNLGSENTVSIFSLAQKIASIYKIRYGDDIHIRRSSINKQKIATEFIFSIDNIKRYGYKPSSSLENEINNIFDFLEYIKTE